MRRTGSAGRETRSLRGAAAACVGALLAAPGLGATGSWFREVAVAWGLPFQHHHGGSGRRYIVETVPGGVVLLDYDGDGDVDVFFVDGGTLPGYAGEPPRSRLYRNDGAGRFVDATAASGIEMASYGLGGAAGDVEGDGDLDLYVTGFGPNALFCGDGQGGFSDCTAEAGVGDPRFSASATFGDPDRDGDLDLYVGDYVEFTIETHKTCQRAVSGVTSYCQPAAYPSAPDRYYRNRGDGTYEDATEEAGLAGVAPAPALGAIFADLTEDGWPDLYVANDGVANTLFANRRDGTFEDVSVLSGTALGPIGEGEAGMGVDAGDFDGDGRLDVVVTNFEIQSNALYRGLGRGLFQDARYTANLAEASFPLLGFGVDLADFDHDGDLDLAVANGHVLDNAAEVHPNSRYPQRNQLFENRGGRFTEVFDAGLELERVSRGLAAGDLDGDGDLDLVVSNLSDVAEVWENLAGERGAWILVDLVDGPSAPGGIGARLTVEAAGRRQVEEARTGSSYLSQNALTVHFGLGERARVDALGVDWPSGRRQRFLDLPARRRLRILE
jgi:hypothetical protein